MAIYKKFTDNQLYLYMNGKLIYKRWLKQGYSVVFDVMAYTKHTLVSIRDLEFEANQELISIKAKLTLKSTQESGRKTGIISGYRPDHVFEYQDGQLLQTYIGDLVFEGPKIEPGEERIVTVRFLASTPVEQYLKVGFKWWVHEGATCLGTLEMISVD